MPAIIFNIAFTTASSPRSASVRQRVEHAQLRAYYNWTAPYNFKAYMEDQKKTETHKDYADYMKKGDVLFNQDGVLSQKKLDEVKANLATTKSIIWHGFISFDEECSKQFNSKSACIDFLHDTFNVLLDHSHLDSRNVELIASLHTDTEHHHHIHFTFFEKSAKKNGTYARKGTFSQRAIDNFVVSSNLYLDERRQQLHIKRDRLIERIKQSYPTRQAREYSHRTDEVAKAVTQLAAKLPEDGRLGYNSANMAELRKDVDKVVNLLISKDKDLANAYVEWQNELRHREDVARRAMTDSRFAYVSGERKKLPTDSDAVATNVANWDNIRVIEDIRKDMSARLGNYVIKLAANVSRAKSRLTGKPTRAGKIIARQARSQLARGVRDIARAMVNTIERQKTDFTRELHKAEYEVQTQQRKVSNGK